MTLARWQASIVDDAGNIQSSATVTVRREITGAPLATLYSDRDGETAIGNPMTADSEGFAAFHVIGGAYRITAIKGEFSKTWRYVGIGLAAERDFIELFNLSGAWAVDTTYATSDLVSHEGFAFVSNGDGNIGNEPTVTGSPSDTPASDANWTHIGTSGTQGIDGAAGSSDVTGTSPTSLTIGTGSKTFTVAEEARGWAVGARLRASSDANPTVNYMEGVVTAYSGDQLTVNMDNTAGSGTLADWTINLTGDKGEQGADGADGTNATASLQAIIDGGGAAISTGIKGWLEVPFACTITAARALADQSGSIVVDIWKDTFANYPPTDADSITASAPVTISASNKSEDTTLTGWTTNVAAGDILYFNVDSASTIERCNIALTVTKT